MQEYAENTVDYAGLESWSGPATWGQATIWAPIRWYAPDDFYFNLNRVLALGPGLAPDGLAAVLRELADRHPALRTGFELAEDGSLRQVVHGEGTIPVRRIEATREQAGEVASAALALDRLTRFEVTTRPPARVLAVGTEDEIYVVALVILHVITDGGGMEVLVDDLRRLAAHRRRNPARLPPRPEGRTPREQAEYEAGPSAQRRSAAALEQWRTALADAPARLLPPFEPAPAADADADAGDTTASAAQRWREARLLGPAVDLASRFLAERWHRTPGAVALAAFAATFTRLIGPDPVALKVILGNRVSPAQRTAVGSFAQNGLVCLRTGDATLADLAARADAGLLAAARHGHYDPVALAALVAALGEERGEHFELTSYFNDFRPPAAPPEPEQVRALEPGPVHWGEAWAKQDSLMFFEVWQQDGRALTRLLADTFRLPPPRVEALLLGVQDLLLREARGALDADEV